MAQQLTMPAAFLEDLSLVPSTHTRQLMTACNSNSKDYNHLLVPGQVPVPHGTHSTMYFHYLCIFLFMYFILVFFYLCILFTMKVLSAYVCAPHACLLRSRVLGTTPRSLVTSALILRQLCSSEDKS